MFADVARFRAFLATRGHAADWPDSRLWLALRLAERLRGDLPGHPFRGNQHTGGIGGAKMAPDAGDGSGAGGTAPAGNNEGRRHAAVQAAKDEVRGKSVEHAIVIAHDGSEIGRRVGDAHSATIPEKWLRDHPGAVLVHNHPGGGPPSPSDCKALHLGAEHVAAVTLGHDHTIRLAAGTKARDAKAEYARFSTAWSENLRDSRRLHQVELLAGVENGRLSRKEALESYRDADNERQHRAWLETGHRFGIEYTRVEHHD